MQGVVDDGGFQGIAGGVIARLDLRLGGIEHRVYVVPARHHHAVVARQAAFIAGAELDRYTAVVADCACHQKAWAKGPASGAGNGNAWAFHDASLLSQSRSTCLGQLSSSLPRPWCSHC